MRVIVERWRKVIKEIDDAIEHSADQGLPLSGIELDQGEWDAFVIARTTLVNGNRIDASWSDEGRCKYKGIQITRAAPDVRLRPPYR